MNVTKSFPSGVQAGNWGEGRSKKSGERSAAISSFGVNRTSPERASAVVPFTLFSRKQRRVMPGECAGLAICATMKTIAAADYCPRLPPNPNSYIRQCLKQRVDCRYDFYRFKSIKSNFERMASRTPAATARDLSETSAHTFGSSRGSRSPILIPFFTIDPG